MAHPQQESRAALLELGFRPCYESAAVTLLEHPDYPDYLVRLGVTRVVVERERQEIYRSAYDHFAVARILTMLSVQE